jgi:hypothetical protein
MFKYLPSAFRTADPKRRDKTTVHKAADGRYDVYIGEQILGADRIAERFRSPWENPFTENLRSRPDQAQLAFASFLRKRLSTHSPAWRHRIRMLKGLRLGCSCDGKHCHGRVLAILADGLPEEPELQALALQSGLWFRKFVGLFVDRLLQEST